VKSHESQRPSDDEAIKATAAAWLAERDDNLAPEREAEFVRWRTADPRHEAAIIRLENAWGALQQLRDFRPEAQMHPDSDLLRRGARPARIMPFPAIAAVALAACVAVAAVWTWSSRPRGVEAKGRHYATTVDGYQRVALEDGSVVELNANTVVEVQFTREERRVRLERGEAHFTVAKNPARPFSVDVGTMMVRAVGTAFNVRLGATDVEVLVTEGKVELNPFVGPALAAGPSRSERDDHHGLPTSGSPTSLNAHERIRIPLAVAVPVAPPIVEKLAPEAVREALTWQGPRLVFIDTPLAEVIAQFNRRNQVQLELADVELGALPIGGSFRTENVEAFVRLLALGNEIAVERPQPGRIVLRKQK